MSNRSYVSLEQAQCPVCMNVFDTGCILLDRRMKASMERHTVTHHALCTECTGRIDGGFVALIEASSAHGEPARTGRVGWITKDAWKQSINAPLPPKGLAFVEVGVMP